MERNTIFSGQKTMFLNPTQQSINYERERERDRDKLLSQGI
jgi:hypothetical protein